ncbi:MAG: FxsA family protein [Actinobacteria bacterium]|uniref:Unannotated protein n=1 Tax=freshwater metagenome TaxID=449393 RepID=A0A6J6QZJ7_9ZZZZ|nr:FxsA family protein [Actinomycetota bacterium]
MSRRRRGLTWVLVLLFIVVPVLEIYVIVQVGQVIGALWTVVLLIVDSIIGSWLVRREGARTWRALRSALESGKMPATELADGALVLVGGTLMLAPGFVTDVVAVLLILPVTRPIFRRLLGTVIARRLQGAVIIRPGHGTRPGPGPDDGSVVRGEVVDD